MAVENGRVFEKDKRCAPRLLPYLDSAPIQVLIPSTGKKLLGFLLDESADGVAVQVRRTRCLAAGDRVQIGRNGRIVEALVKNVADYGLSSRIGLEWAEPIDDRALVASLGARK